MATTFFSRFKGLMGSKNLPESHGLYITKCNAIHMFFMRFPIDVVFIDKSGQIIYLIEEFKPWKVSKIVKGAVDVLELPAGTLRKKGVKLHDYLKIIP